MDWRWAAAYVQRAGRGHIVSPCAQLVEYEKALRGDANTAHGCSKADPQTNTQTDRGDYNTLRNLARSVIISALLAIRINKSLSYIYSY